MTTFNAKGEMTSCFIPPRDKSGRVLSYADVRARQGIPIGDEEAAARAEYYRLLDISLARPRRDGDRADWIEASQSLWAADKRLRLIVRPITRGAMDRVRADFGVPVTEDEIAARAEYDAIEDAVVLPWPSDQLRASNEAHARWRTATAAAFEAMGVDDPDRDDLSGEEFDRRRASLARMKAGLLPMVPAHDVTFDDEPMDEVVLVPLEPKP